MHFQSRSTPNQGYLLAFIIFLAYKYELIGKHSIKIDVSILSKSFMFMELEKRCFFGK
jgi:hypothetical protein